MEQNRTIHRLESDQHFSQLYLESMQATEGTQAAPIESEKLMREHRRSGLEPSSPVERGFSRGSAE